MFQYKLFKKVLGIAECKTLIKKIDKSLYLQSKKFNNKQKKLYLYELMNPFVYEKFFFNLFKINKLNTFCSKILGNNIHLNAFSALKKIPIKGKLRSDVLHIDGKSELDNIKKNLQLNILFSLTKSDKHHGTTALKVKNKMVYLDLNPGDCVVFNSYLRHKGTANKSDKTRYVIGYNLIPHFIKPRFDYVSMTKDKFFLDKKIKNFLGYNFQPPKHLDEFLKRKSYKLYE